MCQLLAKWLNWLSNNRNDNQVQQFQNNNSELLEEENQVILDGLCSVKTWTFLLPSKKHWINIPIHALVSGILVFLSSQMLSNSNIQSSIGTIYILRKHNLRLFWPPPPYVSTIYVLKISNKNNFCPPLHNSMFECCLAK